MKSMSRLLAMTLPLLWLNTSTAADLELPEVVLGEAPKLPEWPDAPDIEVRDGWACLPPARARVTHQQLMLLERYPALCQAAIDGGRAIDDARRLRDVDLCRADMRAALATQKVESAERWPVWQVVIAVGAGVLAGAGIGAIGALVAR